MTRPLATQKAPGFDVILGNPPFLNQVENATTVAKGTASVARLLTGDSSVRYTDVSATFLLFGCSVLRDGGYASMVQPQSLLSAKAAGPVRDGVLRECSLRALWVSNEHVFEASVFTCAPTLQKSGPRRGSCNRTTTSAFVALPELQLDNDDLRNQTTWSHLVAEASGVPDVQYTASGTVGDTADSVADFTEYYRLEGFVVEFKDGDAAAPHEYPPLVTTGLIDLAVCTWGSQTTRIFKQKWDAPCVDRRRMYSDGTLGPWIDKRRVPKIVMATQTRVIEVYVDEPGRFVASIPLITITPSETSRLWHIAVALASPVICAIAIRKFAGAALSADAIKLSAKQVLQLPMPARSGEWDAAAEHFKAASHALDEASRNAALRRAAESSVSAFCVPVDQREELIVWWWHRFVGASETGVTDEQP
jgi:hypothetical protein